MVSFRKSLMVLALLALCAGLALAAPQCTTSGGTAVIRAEGVTELLNDVTVTCTDTVSAAAVTGTYNITLYSTSTNVTSVPWKSDGTGGEVLFTGAKEDPNTTSKGIIGANGLTVSFADAVIAGADYVAGPPSSLVFSFAITGLRVNASTLTQGGPAFAAGVNFTLLAQPVDNLSPAGLFGDSPILNIANVAYAIPTFGFGLNYTGNPKDTGSAFSFAQCSTSDTATPTADTPAFPSAFFLQFNEVYSAAFKNETDEGGFATQGTRLTATITGIPANTQLYVPLHAGSTTAGVLGVTLVSGAKADGSGGTVGATTGGIADGATPVQTWLRLPPAPRWYTK